MAPEQLPEPWPGWPLPDRRPSRDPKPARRPGGPISTATKHWPKRKVHLPQRIERPDLLRGHLVSEHGYTEDGLFPMPERLVDCFELHAKLHRENPGGRLMGPSR